MKTHMTLVEAISFYKDEKNCIDVVAKMRWQDGKPVCPLCQTAEGARRHYWLDKQKRWKCYSCRKQFSVKVGTIFEDSALPLSNWLVAMWMLANCRNGVSSHEIARHLGITQKSAWFLLQRIRKAMQGEIEEKLGTGAPVETDECFVGGNPKFMHAARRQKLHTKSGIYGDHKMAVDGDAGSRDPAGAGETDTRCDPRDLAERNSSPG
jgi:transposase-like protein